MCVTISRNTLKKRKYWLRVAATIGKSFRRPGFRQAKNSRIYVDKSKLIEYLNDRLSTEDKCLAVSHARRFGKSHAAGMIDAYYSLGCDSTELFDGTKISESADYKKYMNKYNVIHLDIASVWDFYKEDLVESIKIISRTGIYYGNFTDKKD